MITIKSRLLKRLDAEIAAAPTVVRSASLKAQRAMLLARHGQLTLAREQLTNLHQLAFQHPHPEIGAWLHFAEGLMSYYTDFGSSAQDKIHRAQVIARAAGIKSLEALTAAWLANLAYVHANLANLIRQARHCDELAAPDQHDARYRLCMIMGLALHFAGDLQKARPWYAKARVHAAADGDDVALSALMYNMAEMRTAQARRESLYGNAGTDIGLLAGVNSIRHYDAFVGGSVKAGLTPLLLAQSLTVEGDFAQARALYETHLPEAMSQGLARLGSSLLADLAWCRVNTGQTEHAMLQANEAELELDPSCDVDDRAATHSRLAQVYTALGSPTAAARHAELAAKAWAEFAQEQRTWSEALRDAGF